MGAATEVAAPLPPVAAREEATSGEEATGAPEAAGEDPPPFPLEAVPQVPVGGVPVAAVTTSAPGLGNKTFVFDGTVQPFPMFATKVSGRLERPGEEPPPVIVTTAQFMYISLFPSKLNHVLL